MKEINFKNLNYTVLGANNKIVGDLEMQGDTIIHSQIEGTITIKDTSNLIIERKAKIDGTIYCHDVEVFGKVFGNIYAEGKLTIRSSAEVSGVIKAKKLSIYPGAILNMEAHAENEESK
jgi:cytoskeletal protein CcmA (bactofilin family)